jgi:hydroxyacylglutathione hydrolase
MLKVTPVEAFSDNYIWLIHGRTDPCRVAIVDPGDPRPVLNRLEDDGLEAVAILATHHHSDHIGGVNTLVDALRLPVYGPASERIPRLDYPLRQSDRVSLESLGIEFGVIDCPGHTAGHIAYHGHGALFCGDTLFSAGCGRLFEGTPKQMTNSLEKLAALPEDTHVYCTHEYTISNLRFAAAVEPGNDDVLAYLDRAGRLRKDDRPTLPTTLELEKRVNPFLRCAQEDVRRAAERHIGRALHDNVAVFAAVRAWKDGFRA